MVPQRRERHPQDAESAMKVDDGIAFQTVCIEKVGNRSGQSVRAHPQVPDGHGLEEKCDEESSTRHLRNYQPGI